MWQSIARIVGERKNDLSNLMGFSNVVGVDMTTMKNSTIIILCLLFVSIMMSWTAWFEYTRIMTWQVVGKTMRAHMAEMQTTINSNNDALLQRWSKDEMPNEYGAIGWCKIPKSR